MATRYYVTPYDPSLWRDPDADSSTRPHSNLNIKISDFNEAIRQYSREAVILLFNSWEIRFSNNQNLSGSFSGDGNQILTLEVGQDFNEFVFWYRSYVPAKYALFLFSEGEWNSLELTPETHLRDIAQFTGL